MGNSPLEMGLSWLGVEVILNSPDLVLTSQAQPLPNWLTPAASNFSLKASKLPKVLLMASATAPVGLPPFFGPIICQNMVWFTCPPPLLRMTPRTSSGSALRLRKRSSGLLLPSSGCFSIAPFIFIYKYPDFDDPWLAGDSALLPC